MSGKNEKNPKPLSYSSFIRSNARKTATRTLALALSIFMLLVFSTVFHVVKESGRLAMLARVERLTEVYPKETGIIDDTVIQQILDAPGVGNAVPVLMQSTEYTHFFSVLSIPVYFVQSSDMAEVLQRAGMKLKAGRLPEAGRNEIALDERVLKNQGKKLGDQIGREADPREALAGNYRIVGVLEGDCFLGVSPVRDGALSLSRGMLLFASDAKPDAMNEGLKGVPGDKAFLMTKQFAEEKTAENTQMINQIMGVAAVAMLFVLAFASGNSSYAQYFSRRYEFGMLQAVGYTRSQVLLRAAKEIALMSLTGFLLGIALGMLAGLALDVAYLAPHGFPYTLMTADMMVGVSAIPLSAALFGIIPVGMLMTKIDPMTIMEKFE